MKVSSFYLITFVFIFNLFFAICIQPSDNDFSEFDDLDEPEIKIDNTEFINENLKTNQNLDNDNKDKANEDDFKNILSEEDEEEVTIEEDNQLEDDLPSTDKLKNNEKTTFEPIKLSSLPLHLRNNWTSYYIELTIVFGILAYFINFFIGSSTNQKLAENFWNINYDLLRSHFVIVGDDGGKEIDKETYVKDSDNMFVLWSTGRFGYECCIIELHFKKRQDLLSSIYGLIKPINDQMIVKIFLKDDSMDSFVFCLANKKTGFKSIKEYNDVVTFCTQRKSIDKYTFLNDNFTLLNEIGDVTSLVLDSQLINLLASSPELINFIHISDQFSGLKPSDQDAQPTKAPTVKKVLTLSFNFPKNVSSTNGMDLMKEFLSVSLNLAERVKRFKLKKDMKQKAIANRRKVEEYYEKLLNVEKQQAAQLKREEKRRLEKEKIIDANDEFKLRKFEDREYKKEMKKKLKPKMKQIRAN